MAISKLYRSYPAWAWCSGVRVLLLTTLAMIFAGLRMYTRGKISHCYGLDDILLLLALVSKALGYYLVTFRYTVVTLPQRYLRLDILSQFYLQFIDLAATVTSGMFLSMTLLVLGSSIWNFRLFLPPDAPSRRLPWCS